MLPDWASAKPSGPVERLALPQLGERAGASVGSDCHLEQPPGGRVAGVHARLALLSDDQRASVGGERNAGGPELAAVELGVGQPRPGVAPARPDAPERRLAVVGDVEAAVRPPGCVVGDGAVGERRQRRLVAGARVEHERPRRRLVEQDQAARAVARRHLYAVGLVQRLPGDRPRAQERAVVLVLEHARGHGVAGRVVVGALVDPPAGGDVGHGRKAGLGDQGEHARVPAVAASRGRGNKGKSRDGQREPAPQPARTSFAARSPERTAPSM